MTPESSSPASETRPVSFSRGSWFFMGCLGVFFVAVAVAIPIMVITSTPSIGDGSVSAATTEPAPLPGERLVSRKGCLACHNVEGAETAGPSWLGIYGSEQVLDSGEIVLADDAYLLESIIDPMAKQVAGFDPIMPPGYGDRLTEQEIADIIEYIKSLS